MPGLDSVDWYKYFKCSEIDPTVLPREVIHKIRSVGIRQLLFYKLIHYPGQTLRFLRRFLRYMPFSSVVYLIVKPFLGRKRGATKAEVISRAVEHSESKNNAAALTQLPDTIFEKDNRPARTADI
jgi:anaerobic magnesium-protoporphyrin IX monomethyl ester cyclase